MLKFLLCGDGYLPLWGRASSLANSRAYLNLSYFRSSREPTVIRLASARRQNQKNTTYPNGCAVFLVEATGLAPLAARPAPTLSTSGFAVKFRGYSSFVRQSVLLLQNGSHPQVPSQCRKSKKDKTPKMPCLFWLRRRDLNPRPFGP